METWQRFQGNPRVVTIFHPGKLGWTVYMRIFQHGLPRSRQLRPGSRQAGQPPFLYRRTEILPKKIGTSRDIGKAGQPS